MSPYNLPQRPRQRAIVEKSPGHYEIQGQDFEPIAFRSNFSVHSGDFAVRRDEAILEFEQAINRHIGQFREQDRIVLASDPRHTWVRRRTWLHKVPEDAAAFKTRFGISVTEATAIAGETAIRTAMALNWHRYCPVPVTPHILLGVLLTKTAETDNHHSIEEKAWVDFAFLPHNTRWMRTFRRYCFQGWKVAQVFAKLPQT